MKDFKHETLSQTCFCVPPSSTTRGSQSHYFQHSAPPFLHLQIVGNDSFTL